MTCDQTSAKWWSFGPSGEGCGNSLCTSALLASLSSPTPHTVRRDEVFSSLSFSDITCASKHEQQMLYKVLIYHRTLLLSVASLPLQLLYPSRSR